MPLSETNKNQGVALLYAVLMVSIVLTISLSLLNITFKQIVLTAVSRESQVAHFTALSALDCVDFTDRSFRDSSGNDTPPNPFGKFTFSESGVILEAPVGNSLTFSCAGGAGQINADASAVGGLAPKRCINDSDPACVTSASDHVVSRYKMTGPGLIGSCATVEVAKVYSGDYADFGEGSVLDFRGTPGGDSGKVMATAYGYNTCDTVSSRLVERRARVRSR